MLECIVHQPKGAVSGTVIWLHGLGASGDDFVPVRPHLNLPNFRFVFPHAPVRPVTLNRGMRMRAWYDIHYLEPGPDRESLSDAVDSERQIVELIDRELSQGIPSNRIVLAGFSQGSAMALHTGHRYSKPLMGIIALSGYVVGEDTFGVQGHVANAKTPFFMGHGTQDMVVPLTRGQRAHELVSAHHPHTKWKTYPMGHEVCMPEIHAIRDWLQALV